MFVSDKNFLRRYRAILERTNPTKKQPPCIVLGIFPRHFRGRYFVRADTNRSTRRSLRTKFVQRFAKMLAAFYVARSRSRRYGNSVSPKQATNERSNYKYNEESFIVDRRIVRIFVSLKIVPGENGRREATTLVFDRDDNIRCDDVEANLGHRVKRIGYAGWKKKTNRVRRNIAEYVSGCSLLLAPQGREPVCIRTGSADLGLFFFAISVSLPRSFSEEFDERSIRSSSLLRSLLHPFPLLPS